MTSLQEAPTGRIAARSAQLATTDFPSLVVSLSMLAAPYREAATVGASAEPATPEQFLTDEMHPHEEEFVVDLHGNTVETSSEYVTELSGMSEAEGEDESTGFAAAATDEFGDLLENDVTMFAANSTEGSGDLLDETVDVEIDASQPETVTPSAYVPMPTPPAQEAVPVFGAPAAAPQPLYTPERAPEPEAVADTELQPLDPLVEHEEAEETEPAPAVDPNIAAIVFPKSPATTEVPVPSVAGFDPSRYFNFDDSGAVEDNLEAGSEFGVPQRAANSPEALKALKELSAFRDR